MLVCAVLLRVVPSVETVVVVMLLATFKYICKLCIINKYCEIGRQYTCVSVRYNETSVTAMVAMHALLSFNKLIIASSCSMQYTVRQIGLLPRIGVLTVYAGNVLSLSDQ